MDSVLNKKPTMPELRRLELPDGGAIDIAERISVSYKKFGSLLLNDDYGNHISIIAHDNMHKAVDVSVDILRKWLKGSGRLPVTWYTLIETLKAVGEHELVRQITEAMTVMTNFHESL